MKSEQRAEADGCKTGYVEGLVVCADGLVRCRGDEFEAGSQRVRCPYTTVCSTPQDLLDLQTTRRHAKVPGKRRRGVDAIVSVLADAHADGCVSWREVE